MARRWAVLQHVPFDGPGLIATVARERGIDVGAVVAMGGPMGVVDGAAHA